MEKLVGSDGLRIGVGFRDVCVRAWRSKGAGYESVWTDGGDMMLCGQIFHRRVWKSSRLGS